MKTKNRFNCVLVNGIHARPATYLKEMCTKFSCAITLTNLRNGHTADAKSVLALVGTDTLLNDEFSLSFDGAETQCAMTALTHYIKDVFPYCDDAFEVFDNNEKVMLPQSLTHHKPTLLHGKRLAQGVAKGLLINYLDIDLNKFLTVSKSNENTRFAQAYVQVCAFLEKAQSKAFGQEKEIISAHLAIIKDKFFVESIEKKLSSHSTAHAILEALKKFTKQLSQSSNPYIRDRVLDIKDVALQLLSAAYPSVDTNSDFRLSEASILIAKDLTPSQFLSLDKSLLKGLILSQGASTSHTVILARSFNIPTLSGIEATQCSCAINQQIYIDANIGVIAIEPNEGVCCYFNRAIILDKQCRSKQNAWQHQEAQTLDAKRVEIAANIGSSMEASIAFNKGAEGIGLFRTEMLFMDRSAPPDETEQYIAYREALDAANGKPVIIRTMDVGGDKSISYLNLPAEQNPFLGYRAVRIYPEFLSIFHTQLRAILRASKYGNTKIMIPMIQSIEEIRWVKKQIKIVMHQLTDDNLDFDEKISLGIMVEIPSVAFMIDKFCQEVDFFSIGSNDMTQYLLAVDRTNANVANLYNSLSPAFLRMLNSIVKTAHQHDRWVGLCGEFGADVKVLPLLIGAGLDEISMSIPSIITSKIALSQLNWADCKMLFSQACDCSTISEVHVLLDNATLGKQSKALLDIECVLNCADYANKEEAIQAMVGNLGLLGRTSDTYKLEGDIWAREAVFATDLGHGFAIPHAQSDHILNSSISIARLNKPIDWQSGSEEIDFIIMLTVSKKQGDQHMRIFSRLARKLIHSDFRSRLRTSENSAELVAFLQKELDISSLCEIV